MYESELSAQIAVGSISMYFKDKDKKYREQYINRNDWNDFDMSGKIDYDYSDNCNDNDDTCLYDKDNYEIVRTDFIYSNDDHEIRHEPVNDLAVLSDLVMVIKRSEIGDENINDILSRQIYLKLEIGGFDVMSLDMLMNLFLMKIFNRNIKEYDDYIEIPLILFDFNKNNKLTNRKLPLFTLTHHQVQIKIKGLNKSISSGFKYCKYKVPLSKVYNNDRLLHSLETFIIETQTLMYIKSDVYKLSFNHPCKIILVKFLNSCNDDDYYDQDYDFDKIKQIKLSLNGAKPIIWDNDEGEIMKFRICGQCIYAISLSPEFKSKKNIKKIFLGEECGYGINFSRIDNSFLSFDLYESISYTDVHISTFNVNIMRYMSGMCGKAYAN